MQNNPNENLPKEEQTLVDAKVYLGERFGLDDAGVNRLFPQLADIPEDGKITFEKAHIEEAEKTGEFYIHGTDTVGNLVCNLNVMPQQTQGYDHLQIRDLMTLQGKPDTNAQAASLEHDDAEAFLQKGLRSGENLDHDELAPSQPLPPVQEGDLQKGLRSGENLDHDELSNQEQQAFYDAMEGWGEQDLRGVINDPNPDKAAAARKRLTELQAASLEHDDAEAFDLKKGIRSGENLDHDEL